MSAKLTTFKVGPTEMEVEVRIDKETGFFEASYNSVKFREDTLSKLKEAVINFIADGSEVKWVPIIIWDGTYATRKYMAEVGGKVLECHWETAPKQRFMSANFPACGRANSAREGVKLNAIRGIPSSTHQYASTFIAIPHTDNRYEFIKASSEELKADIERAKEALGKGVFISTGLGIDLTEVKD